MRTRRSSRLYREIKEAGSPAKITVRKTFGDFDAEDWRDYNTRFTKAMISSYDTPLEVTVTARTPEDFPRVMTNHHSERKGLQEVAELPPEKLNGKTRDSLASAVDSDLLQRADTVETHVRPQDEGEDLRGKSYFTSRYPDKLVFKATDNAKVRSNLADELSPRGGVLERVKETALYSVEATGTMPWDSDVSYR